MRHERGISHTATSINPPTPSHGRVVVLHGLPEHVYFGEYLLSLQLIDQMPPQFVNSLYGDLWYSANECLLFPTRASP